MSDAENEQALISNLARSIGLDGLVNALLTLWLSGGVTVTCSHPGTIPLFQCLKWLDT